jgi:hypothetical protein
MSHIGGRWRAGLRLTLVAFAWLAVAPGIAQEPASEEMLIERLRQIQGQLPAGATGPARAAALPGQAAEPGLGQGFALGEEEVRALVSEGLGVEVLSIEALDQEGRPTYAVTVINPPGDADSALAVETLLIDGATGEWLGRVSQTPRVAAPGIGGAPGSGSPDRSGTEIRRRTWR